MNDAIYISM